MRVAAYIAIDGELDPSPIAAAALRLGCALYLPRITDFRSRRMRFERATAVSRPNRMRIPEPAAGPGVGAQRLNLVFVPLVAFDPRGERLGMGHGYYDRALAFRRLRSAWPGPRIVGLGYAFQELPLIEEAAHDVRLDAVLTDGATHLFRERKR
jgi:5-formyltetrahydrofolate cyclo-ligase